MDALERIVEMDVGSGGKASEGGKWRALGVEAVEGSRKWRVSRVRGGVFPGDASEFPRWSGHLSGG